MAGHRGAVSQGWVPSLVHYVKPRVRPKARTGPVNRLCIGARLALAQEICWKTGRDATGAL